MSRAIAPRPNSAVVPHRDRPFLHIVAEAAELAGKRPRCSGPRQRREHAPGAFEGMVAVEGLPLFGDPVGKLLRAHGQQPSLLQGRVTARPALGDQGAQGGAQRIERLAELGGPLERQARVPHPRLQLVEGAADVIEIGKLARRRRKQRRDADLPEQRQVTRCDHRIAFQSPMPAARGIALGIVERREGNPLGPQIGFELRFVPLQADHEARATRLRGPTHHIDQMLGRIGNDDLGVTGRDVAKDRKTHEQGVLGPYVARK